MASLQEGPRVELGQVRGLVGPAHGRKRPQATAEPCIQHILILHMPIERTIEAQGYVSIHFFYTMLLTPSNTFVWDCIQG